MTFDSGTPKVPSEQRLVGFIDPRSDLSVKWCNASSVVPFQDALVVSGHGQIQGAQEARALPNGVLALSEMISVTP